MLVLVGFSRGAMGPPTLAADTLQTLNDRDDTLVVVV